jgi:hypothetical protein
MKKAFGFVCVLAIGALFVIALFVGMNRQEVVECDTWAQQASQYPAFYLTQWQADQCAAHHITVNAPVK